MAVNHLLGMEAAIYFSTTVDPLAFPAVSTMTELDNATEVTLNLTTGEADVTTRANNGWRATVATLKEASVDFTMIWKPGDVGFEAVRDAFLNNDEIHLAVLDNDAAVSGAQGLKGNFTITNFTRNEALEEAITVSVTVKLSVFDEWHEVA